MSDVQILASILIAVVAALVTAFANNFWESRRLRDMWKRETQERRAYYKRQRLDEMLEPIREHTYRLLQAFSVTGGTARQLISEAEMKDVIMDMTRADISARATAQAVGDEALTKALARFFYVVADAGVRVGTVEEGEHKSLVVEVTAAAALVLRRCDELLEQAYAESLPVSRQ